MGLIKLVIIDDHELVRYALRSLLSSQAEMRIVGEGATGREAVDLCSSLEPDVLILDLRMQDMDGIDACRLVSEKCPDTRVLVLTSYDDDESVFGTFEAGSAGYLMKDVAPRALVDTIRQIAQGRTVLDERISERLMSAIDAPRHQRQQRHGLSEREFEVLQLMAKGLSNRQIGESLWIGEATVKTHVSRVLRKLNTNQRTQAIVLAVSEGLVDANTSLQIPN